MEALHPRVHTPRRTSLPTPKVTGTTRLVGLVGGDVRHSLSLGLHNHAFQSMGLDWLYLPLPVPGGSPARLRDAVHGLRALGFVGANITMPHKELVLEHLDDITDSARRIGAVNTIKVRDDGRLIGGNTDAAGFLADLDAHAIDWRARPALILGAGGAARAVAHALAAGGTRSLCLVNRTHDRAVRLATELEGEHSGIEVRVERWLDGLPCALQSNSMVVNCTSVGMTGTPAAHRMPWPEALDFGPDQAVVDVVYTPVLTPLLQRARLNGARVTLPGVGMLVHQAALAFAWWTDARPPVPEMLAAARSCLETP